MSRRVVSVAIATLMLSVAAPVITHSKAIAQNPTDSGSVILDSDAGRSLVRKWANDFITLSEFLAAQKFSTTDRRQLAEDLTQAFRSNPSAFIETHQAVRETLEFLKPLKDPIQIAKARQLLVTNRYLSMLQSPAFSKLSINQVIFRYSPVVVADPAAKLVVTERAIDAAVATRKFATQIAGRSFNSASDRANLRRWLTQNFQALPLEVKQRFANAESGWLEMQTVYSRLTPQQRQQFEQQLRQQILANQGNQPAQASPTAAPARRQESSTMERFNRSIERANRATEMMIKYQTILNGF